MIKKYFRDAGTRHEDRRILREVRDLRVLELLHGRIRLEEQSAQRGVVRSRDRLAAWVLDIEKQDLAVKKCF